MNFIIYILYAIKRAIKRASKSTSDDELEEFMKEHLTSACDKMIISNSKIDYNSQQQIEQTKKEIELKLRERFNNKEIDENGYESIQRILAELLDEVQNEDIDLKHDDESNADSNINPDTDPDTEDG